MSFVELSMDTCLAEILIVWVAAYRHGFVVRLKSKYVPLALRKRGLIGHNKD